MTSTAVNLILKRIDLNYGTNYYDNTQIIEEWYRDLRKYDYPDVDKALDRYMKNDTGFYPPKRNVILRGVKTSEQKYKESNLKTFCPICFKAVGMLEYERHYHRCMDIEYIATNVKKYLNKEIDYKKYCSMSEEELNKKFDQIASIVYNKTENQTEKLFLKKYLKERNLL